MVFHSQLMRYVFQEKMKDGFSYLLQIPLFMGSLFLMNIISLITSVPNGMVWVFLQKNTNHNIKCKCS